MIGVANKRTKPVPLKGRRRLDSSKIICRTQYTVYWLEGNQLFRAKIFPVKGIGSPLKGSTNDKSFGRVKIYDVEPIDKIPMRLRNRVQKTYQILCTYPLLNDYLWDKVPK
jgi:hypothetical protein